MFACVPLNVYPIEMDLGPQIDVMSVLYSATALALVYISPFDAPEWVSIAAVFFFSSALMYISFFICLGT